MNEVSVLPNKINQALSDLKPKVYIPPSLKNRPNGILIKDTEQHFYPAEFVKPLYDIYMNYSYARKEAIRFREIGRNYGDRTVILPKLYLLMYRVILNIPNIPQCITVIKKDANFAKSCCFPHPDKPYVGISGLSTLQNELLQLERGNKAFKEALHNLTDELDYKKISFEGLIPSVWVKTYRKQIFPAYDPEFEAAFANNTGIDVIDELTLHLSESYRSDVRQEAALNCLEIGMDKLTTDNIMQITKSAIKRYRNEYFEQKYKHRSLFSKPYHDSDTELWQTIVDPMAENPEIIAEKKEEEELIKSILLSHTNEHC